MLQLDKFILVLTTLGLTLGQDKDFSLLQRHSLQDYSLAKCTDGTPAAYYADKIPVSAGSSVMIYLSDSGEKTSGFGGSCTYIDDCQKSCLANPRRCQAPLEITRIQTGGIWSRDEVNNPFANFFKVYVPSCSLDEFSGTRGPLDENSENRLVSGSIYFHGRHIFNSLLRDLVAKFGIDRAERVILIGSGSGARGVARSCDFLKDAIATVNPNTVIRCILDGPPDFVPYWIQDDDRTVEQCLKNRQALALKDEETRRFLWGRADDESCIKDMQDKTNSSSLAQHCGIFSRSFREISTPVFVISSQLDPNAFNELTCGVNAQSSDYNIYATAWRRGMLQLAEVMSNDKPENGWFIPNCDEERGPSFLDETNTVKRLSTRAPLFASGEDKNVLQVINNWIRKGSENDEHLAIDPLGVLNPSCSSGKNGKLRSLNLDLRPDLLRRRGNPVVQVVARKPAFVAAAALASRDRFDNKLRGRLPNLPGFQDEDVFASIPLLSDQDLISSQFIDDDSNESAAAAAGAAAAAALAAAERDSSNYRKLSPVRDPFLTSSRFVPPVDLTNPKITDLNPSLDSTINDYDFGEDDFDFGSLGSLGSFIPNTEVSVVSDSRPLLPENSIGLTQSRSRRARLWRRLYYLQYLRELYKRTYRDYYLDYYYGRTNGGTFGRLVKDEKPGESAAPPAKEENSKK